MGLCNELNSLQGVFAEGANGGCATGGDAGNMGPIVGVNVGGTGSGIGGQASGSGATGGQADGQGGFVASNIGQGGVAQSGFGGALTVNGK